MRFHEEEGGRRRWTALLLVLLCSSVAATILGVYGAFAAALRWTGLAEPTWWQPRLFRWTTATTAGVIVLGTIHMARLLARGGGFLARRLGGREIGTNPADPVEKRLRNVVEEAAIASGSPVPGIFVLDGESGINAFAAGLRPDDAAIAVTLGCVALLSRDELQGVVAHELSHVGNGDMRLNASLVALLHGVLLVGQTGKEMLRMAFSRPGESGRRSPILLAIPGAILAGAGYLGLLFGKLLRCAVCRQRELLADASAVRLTRNPGGLAGALKKMGGLEEGSRLRTNRAVEVSHMSFGKVVRGAFLGLLATHPPLRRRILALEPTFSGRFPKVEPLPQPPAPETPLRPLRPAPPPEPGAARPAEFARPKTTPTEASLLFARNLLAAIPEELASAARDPAGARAVAFALLLDPDPAVHRLQLSLLESMVERETVRRTLDLGPQVEALGTSARLPLLDLALPALRGMSAEEYEKFTAVVEGLSRADARIDLFELALGLTLERRLDRAVHGAKLPVHFYGLTGLLPDARVLLSAVAHSGEGDTDAIEEAFVAGAARLTSAGLALAPPGECGPEAVAHSLERVARSAARIRERVLDACAFAAARDGEIRPEEAEVLRAVAAAVDLPLPPFVRA